MKSQKLKLKFLAFSFSIMTEIGLVLQKSECYSYIMKRVYSFHKILWDSKKRREG